MSQITFNLIFGTLLRSAIMMLAGYFASKGLLPQGSVEEWASALVLVILGVGWSLWQKAQQTKFLKAALELPPGSTMLDVKERIATNAARAAANTVVLVVLVLGATACAKTPPNLDPQTQKMFEATEVARRVNRLQATVIELEAQKMIQTDVARTIVRFTVAADQTMLDYPSGWGPLVATAWKNLKAIPDVQAVFAKNPTLGAVVQLVDVALTIWLPKQEAECSYNCFDPWGSQTRGWPWPLWSLKSS